MNIRKEFNLINFIKIVATMCVFCLHTSLFSSSWGGFSFSSKTWFLQTPAWAAVWVFFFLSGYLNGNGFLSDKPKYNFDIRGVYNFYKRRFIKVVMPTWIFIMIACTISEPDFFAQYPMVIIKILTLRYYNDPACTSIGATWYVFVLAQLYILTPFICFFIKKILFKIYHNKKVVCLVGIIVCVFAGLIFRCYMHKVGADWSSKVYVPFYANLDIYISGILLAACKKERDYIEQKYNIYTIIASVLFIVLICVNIYIYYKGNTNNIYLELYQYIFPSIYIIILSFVIYLGCGWNVVYKSENLITKLMDSFAGISFEFYLIHSMVLYRIAPYIKVDSPNKFHIILLGLAFVISVLFAKLFQRGYKGINKK